MSAATSWRRFLLTLLAAFVGALAAVALFIALMNPFGNLPHLLFAEHVAMDEHQRFQYPAVIRTHRYESLVLGTSTARLLDPAVLERHFPGRFAQLAMNSATAWEQTQIARLFLRHTPAPRTLIVGLDYVWCDGAADVNRITHRGFPEWMYDENVWNDLPYMLNARTLEIAGRRVGYALGLARAPLGANGYGVFVPPESKYDLAKARRKIWGKEGPRVISPVVPPFAATDRQKASWRYPALAWLGDIIEPGRWQQVLLVYMPVHIATQPVAGSEGAARDAACRSEIAAIAARAGAHLIDFRLASRLTSNDVNYWDALHVRVPVATRIAEEIATAVAMRADDPAGDWRYLGGPSARQIP